MCSRPLALLLLLIGACSGGQTILVFNHTSDDIVEVRVQYHGGEFVIPKIAPGVSIPTPVKVTQTSSVRVSFVDGRGQFREERDLGRIEPGSRTTVEVLVENDRIGSTTLLGARPLGEQALRFIPMVVVLGLVYVWRQRRRRARR